MIGLALLISILAFIIALFKKGPYKFQVFLLVALAIISFLITLHFTNHKDPNNPFSGIGAAIIGSVVIVFLSFAALGLSLYNKR